MNNCFDVEPDKINISHRSTPSNLVTTDNVIYFSLLLFFDIILLVHLNK